MGQEFPPPYQPEFPGVADRDTMIGSLEVAMAATDDRSLDDGKNVAGRNASPRAFNWFWRPWYAKLFWGLSVVYWIGIYAMMLAPTSYLSNLIEWTMLFLVFIFNPVTIVAVLGFGFLKAKVACGDWVVIPGMSPEHAEWLRWEREAGYINPADARSGYMHQDYLDGL